MDNLQNLNEIIELFAENSDPREVKKLFEELFTQGELMDIAKRWYIMRELYKGTPQRKIAEDLEVSLCKITRGSKVLKQEGSKFRRILGDMFDEDHI